VTLRRSNFMVWAAGAGRFHETVAAGQACVADLATSAPGDAAALSALGDVQYALAMAYAALGRPDDAQHAFARARDAYRAIDHHLMLRAVSEWEICVVAQPYHADQPALRRRLAVESAAARERSSGAYVSNEQHGLLSLAPLLLDGEWDAAREIGRSWLAGRLKHSALGVGATLGVCMLIQLMRDQGDTAPAWELITTFLPDGPRTAAGGASFRDGIELLRLAAELSLDAGDLAAAARWIDAHDRWLVWSGSVLNQAEGRLLRARSARAAGDLTQAYSHAEAALTLASEPRQPLALLAAQRCLGELAADAGRYDTANEHLAASLALAEECAAPFERALTLLAQAELQAASGNAGDARTLAAQVRAICAPLDARPTLARVAALDARLSGQDGGAPPGPARLSPRETEVLRLLAAGHSTKEIAAELGMRVRTAERHIQNLYHKLGVTGRAAAIALAHQHGLT
jgi:DNA-binding CsgD family transcriptional regulator